jgi:outer membrane protein
MKTLRNAFLTATVLACSTYSYNAMADVEFPIAAPAGVNYLGLFVGGAPDYMGSDDYQAYALPLFNYEFANNRNIKLDGNYLSANIVNSEVIHFGPALRYRFGRDNDVEDGPVGLLPEIDDAVEAGATLSATWAFNNNLRNRVTVGVDGLFDVSDKYNGFNGSVYANYWMPVSCNFDIGLAGSLRFGDDNFMSTYFGVTPTGSAASGLSAFNASGGLASAEITPMAIYHINEQWHVGGGVRYGRMLQDAADSPVTDVRGDKDQWMAGVGVIYSW